MQSVGIDYGDGRKGRGSRFRARWDKVKKRLTRVKGAGIFANSVFLFKVGLDPSLCHLAPVFGLHSGRSKQVRKKFATNLSGCRLGHSTNLRLMFSGANELGPLYPASLMLAIAWVERAQLQVHHLQSTRLLEL